MLEQEAKEQQTVLKESVQIQDAYDKDVDRLKQLIDDAQKQISVNSVKPKNIDALKKQIAEHKVHSINSTISFNRIKYLFSL